MSSKFAWFGAIAGFCLVLAACGGGGGGGSSTTTTTSSGTPSGSTTTSGSTSSSTNSTNTTPWADATATPTAVNNTNAVAISVSNQPYGLVNAPMVDVTICPGGGAATNTNCSTIHNVLLDTGSYGLRLFASVVPSGTLSAMAPQTQGSNNVAECGLFVSGYTWGGVRTADIQLGTEVAANVPVQIIGDSNISASAPSECQIGTAMNTPNAAFANGILGVGSNQYDCGTGCVSGAQSGAYYTCSGSPSTCTATTQPLASQVQNPVALFPTDNNGVIVEMAQVADLGATTASGTLVFGIDTASNNTLSGMGATLLKTNNAGNFTATYKTQTFTDNAFFDSGSNGLFFPDSTITRSGSWYAPSTTLPLTASLTNSSGNASATTTALNFNVANEIVLANTGNFAFNDIAGTASGMMDFGLPFFYGRHVYVGIVGKTSTGGGTGPYVAYVSQ
ncbi:DUF3443 family protein [Paraburkholderia sp. SUR17]|uniref:DUF3443 family protein n=1 Tax=Paraburkholderia sp. SUR17 TaxID=3034358 RepID=UPI00240824FC|nr:DUF3443 family protein [Paraburkholderia sp. SUR17]WEY42584.1 DUF3443 family protein [Paraburkholderia sp. SUR17]